MISVAFVEMKQVIFVSTLEIFICCRDNFALEFSPLHMVLPALRYIYVL